MAVLDSKPTDLPLNQSFRWERSAAAEILDAYDHAPAELSQRQFALEAEVSRGTLQFWITRREQLELPPVLALALESPDGVRFLHQLMIDLHLVFVLQGGCGLSKVSQFLELTGLAQLIAPSRSSQHRFCQRLCQEIENYGAEQRQKLAEGITKILIAICVDETFHPQICLVAIEPVSGFILLEQYVQARDLETWQKAMKEATAGLPIEIVQYVSDEATALIAQAKAQDAHHSPDLFHIQQELCKATSLALQTQLRKANEAEEVLEKQIERQASDWAKCRVESPNSAEVNEKAAELGSSLDQLKEAQQQTQTCEQRIEQAKEARQGVRDAYHPFDLATGATQEAEQVEEELILHFDNLEKIAESAGLSSTCKARIQKARKLLVQMLATIAFFWKNVHLQVEGLSLSPELERSFLEELLPAKYLELAAVKAKTAERRREIQGVAQRLSNLVRAGPISKLPEEEQLTLEQEASKLATLFQRSSSCVEGRNGQLSLWHHSVHRLSPLRLSALTVLHNYFICRTDKTTAAERFFGKAPDSLLETLIAKMPFPPRPARGRQVA